MILLIFIVKYPRHKEITRTYLIIHKFYFRKTHYGILITKNERIFVYLSKISSE